MPHPLSHHRIVLLGATGMLGRAWRELFEKHDIEYLAPPRRELDLATPRAIHRAIDAPTTLVINCAAFTDVDAAESRHADALVANAVGPGNIAQRCASINATLVHYSTDYVFPGRATDPYTPDAPAEPVNAYGRTKAQGESRIRESTCKHLIIRTSWLYAPWGKNFVTTMARLCREKDNLRVVDDQHGRPTSAEHLAHATLSLLTHDAAGTFHVTDAGQTTWCQLTQRIAARLNPQCRVEPCTTDEFPRPAPRPAYSVLEVSQTEALVGPLPHWHENLDDVLDRIEEQE